MGACKRLNVLPLKGKDLFAGQFQESIEAESKCLEALDKLLVHVRVNLEKRQASMPQAKRHKQASYLSSPADAHRKPAVDFVGIPGQQIHASGQGPQRAQTGRGFLASAFRYPESDSPVSRRLPTKGSMVG